MTDRFAWFSVAGTVLLTICGQLLIKWRVGGLNLPASLEGKAAALLQQFLDPWIWMALVMAFGASIFWMSAMTRLPLSLAYPFTSISFVAVTLLGVAFLGEPMGAGKVVGVSLVVIGLIVLSRG